MESLFAPLFAPPVGWAVAFAWGLLWGSFFNVCIHRIGLYESIVWPASRCPNCGTQIAAYDNIPVLSWLVLRGRCRSCNKPISIRYPTVEVLTGFVAMAVYWRFFVHGEALPLGALCIRFLAYFFFVGVLIVISGIDLDHMLIPDRITYPAIPLFLLLQLCLRDVGATDCLIGVVAGYAIVAICAETFYRITGREAMGYGDAKLLSLIGGFLGWRAVLVTFLGAPFFGLLIVVPVLLKKGRKLSVEVPYGPFLVMAALVYLFFGRELLLVASP